MCRAIILDASSDARLLSMVCSISNIGIYVCAFVCVCVCVRAVTC
jgi:hypothetical protein